MTVTYRERTQIDRFRCIDRIRTVYLCRYWYSGRLLYGYVDRYNTVCISQEDIIETK